MKKTLLLWMLVMIPLAYAQTADMQNGIVSHISFDMGPLNNITEDSLGELTNGNNIDNWVIQSEGVLISGANNSNMDGTTGGINYTSTNSVAVDPSESNATISMWVMKPHTGSVEAYYFDSGSSLNDTGFGLLSDSFGTVANFYVTVPGALFRLPSSIELDEVWNHVMLTFNHTSNESKLYVNGKFNSTLSKVSATISNSEDDISILNKLAQTPGSAYSNAVDDLCIYNKTLGPTEAQYIYNSGSGNICNPNQKLLFMNFYDEFIGRTSPITDNVTATIIQSTQAKTLYTLTGQTEWFLTDTGETRIIYSSPKYNEREYFFTSNDTVNADLYLLSLGNGTSVTFTVLDDGGTELSNSLVQLKKYYTDTNSYRTVAMVKTNQEGQATIDVDFNDAFYEIFVSKSGFNTNTQGSKIFSTNVQVILKLLSDPFAIFDETNQIISSVDYNNNTKNFEFTFNDISGDSRNYTLTVYRQTASSRSIVCFNSDISSSGTILCNYNVTANPGTYFGIGGVTINPEITLAQKEVITGLTNDAISRFQNQGVFLSVLIAGTMAGLGALVGPVVGILMFIVGLGFVVFFGFSSISVISYITIAIAGFIIMWRLRN